MLNKSKLYPIIVLIVAIMLFVIYFSIWYFLNPYRTLNQFLNAIEKKEY